MAKAPRWKATRTRRQSAGLGTMWAALAVLAWVVVLLPGYTDWWTYVMAIVFTGQAAFFFNSWRLWRPEWDGK